MDFVTILNSNFVVFRSEWPGWRRSRNCKTMPTFSCLDVMYPKVPQVLKWIGFPRKIPLILPFWFLRNVEYFETSTKFGFSTSDDLETAKLQRHCLFNFPRTMFQLRFDIATYWNLWHAFFDITLTTDSISNKDWGQIGGHSLRFSLSLKGTGQISHAIAGRLNSLKSFDT